MTCRIHLQGPGNRNRGDDYFRRIESSSALHTVNNLTDLIMAGLGFGMLTADQSVSSTLFNVIFKLLFLAFIIYADKKLHWFDDVQRDDVEPLTQSTPENKKIPVNTWRITCVK